MDKEEYLQRACQELSRLGATESEIEEFRRIMTKRIKGNIATGNPEEAAQLWMM